MKLEVSFKKYWKLGADFEKTSKLGGHRNLVFAGEAILKKKNINKSRVSIQKPCLLLKL